MKYNIHIRGVDNKMMHQLKEEAQKHEISVNSLILDLLKNGLGLKSKPSQAVYHDLDQLAGSWNEKEAKNFLNTISDFEKIDKEIWK